MTSEIAQEYGADYTFLLHKQEMLNRLPYNAWVAMRAYSEILIPLHLKPGMRLLDVGSCTGDLGHWFKFAGVRTTGVDINLAALKIAIEHWGKEARNHHLQANALNLPFAVRSFDSVVSQDVLEHMHSEKEAATMFTEMAWVNNGPMMLHKVTVLEDKDWIDADETHHLKRSAGWWQNWFMEQGWSTVADTTKKYLVWNRRSLIGIGKMHGYFLLEKSSA